MLEEPLNFHLSRCVDVWMYVNTYRYVRTHKQDQHNVNLGSNTIEYPSDDVTKLFFVGIQHLKYHFINGA